MTTSRKSTKRQLEAQTRSKTRGKDGLTAVQRAFIAEYFAGGERDTVLAYRLASPTAPLDDKKVKATANAVLQKPAAKAALARLRARTALAADITHEEVAERTRSAYALAMASDQPAAAVSAARLLAQMGGLLVDRRETKVTGSIDVRHSTPEELAARISSLARSNGLVIDAEPVTDDEHAGPRAIVDMTPD